MLVRILQILVLLAIINTCTTYVIRDITTYNTTNYNITTYNITTYNSTKIQINDTNVDDHKYSTHNVNFHARGYTARVFDTCIHFLDYQMQSKWTYCSASNKCQKCLNGEILSPDWSVGYYVCGTILDLFHLIEICQGPVIWWDGWVGQKYCSDLHYHLTDYGFKYKLSFNAWPIEDNETCQYPY